MLRLQILETIKKMFGYNDPFSKKEKDKFYPEEAIKYLKSKKLVPTEDWNDLQFGEHSHCFTVAHSMKTAILEDIFSELNNCLKNGLSVKAFKYNIRPTLEKKGWYGGRDDISEEKKEKYLTWRLNLIYFVNIFNAYGAGRYKQMMKISEARPIWVYAAIVDKRTRPQHLELNGKGFRYDNPFWNSFYPPNGWRCRCSVYSLSEDGAKRQGVEVLEETPDDCTKENFCPPEWRYNPGKEKWSPDWKSYDFLNETLNKDGKPLIEEIKSLYTKNMESINKEEGIEAEFDTVESAKYLTDATSEIKARKFNTPKKISCNREKLEEILKSNGIDIKKVISYFNPEDETIYFNSSNELFTEGKIDRDVIEEQYKKKILSTNSIYHSIFKEAGSYYLYNKSKELYQKAKERIFTEIEKQLIEKEVSETATKNGLEFVKDVFAGQIDYKNYNQKIIDIFNELVS